MNTTIRNLLRALALILVAASAVHANDSGAAAAIAPQPLINALNEFVSHTGLQVVYRSELAVGKRSKGASSGLPPRQMLEQLLRDTGLQFEFVNATTVTIRDSSAPAAQGSIATTAAQEQGTTLKLARAEDTSVVERREATAEASSAVDEESDSKGIPEILVKGQRGASADIRRSRDDVQPYVVFDAQQIRSSMAPDIDTFLRSRLPMNQQSFTASMTDGQRGGQSSIDLRGLGPEETLVLVNGRRLPSISRPGSSERFQPDINGIPLSSIERIEILPSTAGGIYGGSATGGVVNVILKRGFQGLEVRGTFDGTTNGGNARRRMEASGGLSLEEGRTSINFSASYADAQPLRTEDRDFDQKIRQRILDTAPETILFKYNFWPIMGSTTNVQSVSGNPLVFVSNGQSLGSRRTHVPLGYAGMDTDDGLALMQAAGTFNTNLPNDAIGVGDGLKSLLISNPTVRSASVNLRREFTGRIEAFLDASNNDNRSQSSYINGEFGLGQSLPVGGGNPFTEPVYVSVSIPGIPEELSRVRSWAQTRSLAGGVIVRLPRKWSVQGEYGWSRVQAGAQYNERQLTSDVLTAINSGALDVFRDLNAHPMDLSPYYVPVSPQHDDQTESVLKDATLRLAGPVWTLPAGPVMLSGLVQGREEISSAYVTSSYSQDGVLNYTYTPQTDVSTDSAYMELNVPLVSAKNDRPLIKGLELQASYRYDRTTVPSIDADSYAIALASPEGPYPEVDTIDVDVTGNQYTFGVRYQPVEQLALRASFGKGVLPPSLSNLAPRVWAPFLVPIIARQVRDPKRGDEIPTAVTRITGGGSPDLRPEQSESLSAGLIFTPTALPGLRVSVDYTRIDKVDEITTLQTQILVNLEDQAFGSRITRGELTAADQALGYTAGPIIGMDTGAVNIASSTMEAFDVQTDYTWQTAYGDFKATLIGTYQPHLQQQVLSDQPVQEYVGYNLGPLELRGNLGLTWSRSAWSLGWNMQYYDSYLIYDATLAERFNSERALRNGSPQVPRQIYHDLYGQYRFGDAPGSGWMSVLQNMEMLVSIKNVFDTEPPIVTDNRWGYFPMSPYGDPRLRSYAITLSKSFQ